MDKCRSCGAEILWAKHAKTDNWMPLEPAPEEAERGLFSVHEASGFCVAVSAAREPLFPDRQLYISHHAICPDAPKWRRGK